MLDWVVGTYVEALNIIHYCNDRYAYEAMEMALHASEIVRTMGCVIAGLSIVADTLSAIKHARVTPVLDETGLVVDYVTEGDFPRYGNDDDRADDIAATIEIGRASCRERGEVSEGGGCVKGEDRRRRL